MPMKFKGFILNDSQKIHVSGSDNREYVSTIEFINEEAITITYPLLKQNSMDLRRGDEVYVKIVLGSHTIEFHTKVKSFRPDNVLLVNLEHPTDFKRIQRRNAVRLKTLINVQIAPLSPDPDDPDIPEIPGNEPLFSRATALDISAGGMEIFTRLAVEKDQDVLVKFCLELDRQRKHDFCIKSKVRRISDITQRSKRLGVEFLEMSTTNSDRIFQYIFKRSTTSIT